MNYTKVYNDLIEKRRKYPLDKKLTGCENHHILPRAKGEWKPIVQPDQSGKVVNEYMSVNDACVNTGILKSSISNCLHGRSVTAGGFFWKFSEDK